MTNIDGLRRRTHQQTSAESKYLRPQPAAQPQYAPEPVRAPEPAPAPRLEAAPATAPAAAGAHAASFRDLHPQRKKLTMIGVILAMLLAALDQTIVGTALPTVVRELGGADHLTWVVTAYLLASTVTVPIYGKLSDLFGRKWFFFAGIVIFLVASVLSGASQNMLQLIIFRGLQGIGGGAIMGNAFAIIGDLFEPAERARWQGALGGVFGLSSVIGPALGGYLTDHASWRWVFYINLPVGAIALAVIAFLMPKVVRHTEDKIIDFWGALTLILTLVPLLLALSFGGHQLAWTAPKELALFGTAVAGLIGFLFAEVKMKEHAIIPLDLFKTSVFTNSIIITFLTGAAMFGAIVYIPLFAQLVQGVSATASGTILTPLMVGLIAASVIAGQIISRTGKYRWVVLVGLSVLVLGLTWLSYIDVDTSQWDLRFRMIALGLGLGVALPTFNIIVQSAFDSSRLGVVTASIQLFRQVGGTVGTAIFGAFFNNTFADQAKALANTQYAKITAAQHLNVADPNLIQGLMSGPGQAQVHQKLATLPLETQAIVGKAFADYLADARLAFTAAIDHVFLVAALTATVALVASLFLKQIPLSTRRPPKKAKPAVKAGDELAVEWGQAEAKDEPVLSKAAPDVHSRVLR